MVNLLRNDWKIKKPILVPNKAFEGGWTQVLEAMFFTEDHAARIASEQIRATVDALLSPEVGLFTERQRVAFGLVRLLGKPYSAAGQRSGAGSLPRFAMWSRQTGFWLKGSGSGDKRPRQYAGASHHFLL